MSIPLDRLYHYIENIAKEVRGDDVIIYRFYPHGSKKIEDLNPTRFVTPTERFILPSMYCNDQEPLNYEFYNNQITLTPGNNAMDFISQAKRSNIPIVFSNLRRRYNDIYDQALVLHSEQRSTNVELYKQNQFIPVYYWSHALIALDWFRFAQYNVFRKTENPKKFLIYNRAWSGTREYRLKFADLLIEHDLVDYCKTSVGITDGAIHYNNHQYTNTQWKPAHCLEQYFEANNTTSCYSADFDVEDYNCTDFEVVLETLFDDQRLHLTEKSLRPIACGQPFILCANHGSLQYLRDYGFKTFGDVIDESYDNIEDPYQRMLAIISVMKSIAGWSEAQRNSNMQKIQEITEYNRKYFFSNEFFDRVVSELKNNLSQAFDELETTNTSKNFIDLRKQLAQNLENRAMLTKKGSKDKHQVLKLARKYYNRYLKTLNK
jgi:hypothetical protein